MKTVPVLPRLKKNELISYALLLVLPLLIWSARTQAAGPAKFNRKVSVGQTAPDWSNLPGVDGKKYSLSQVTDADVLVIVFTCNHCPVAQAYEARLNLFVKEFAGKKVSLLAISPSRFAADNFEKMKERARKKQFQYPYIHDATQATGKAYGATATPQFFVLNKERKITYMGAFDDSLQESKVKRTYVRDAVNALLSGKLPEVTETRPSGCLIDYGREKEE